MESFNKLKYMLTTAPILKIVDPFKDFIVCIDACKEELGGVVIQENYVVDYESRKLKEHEKNYGTHDLECVAIIHALNMRQHCLIRRKKIPFMLDNIILKYLFDQQNLNAKQTMRLYLLSEYNFEIKQIKVK